MAKLQELEKFSKVKSGSNHVVYRLRIGILILLSKLEENNKKE